MRIIVERHYLHRKAPCSFAFGLFKSEKLLGVICYGTPSSSPLRSGICGLREKNNVIELTRLWIDDSVGKNGESFLIGNTIPLIDKEIIVSFAEIEQGHSGVIYQATNWIYTGLSAKRTNWMINDYRINKNLFGENLISLNKHSQTMADKFSSAELRSVFKEKFELVERPRKHRYIYFNASRKRKKELLKKLLYPVLPYPK